MNISIIIPIYNTEAYLPRCIASVLTASRRSSLQCEIILVDDGSSDASTQICDQFAFDNDEISVIHQKNQGVSAARNTGIEQATGEFILFVDSDDVLEDHALLFLEQNLPSADSLLVFSLAFIEFTGKKEQHIDVIDLPTEVFLKKAEKFKSINFLLCSPINKLYSVQILKTYHVRFINDMKFGEDFVFNIRYLRYVKKIVSLDTVLYNYDCTVEDSAVKQFYPEYDLFINTMQIELEKTFSSQNIPVENVSSFVDKFIEGRWLYALSSCLFSQLSWIKKRKILLNWNQKISPSIQKSLYNRNDSLCCCLKKADNFPAFSIQYGKMFLQSRIQMIRRYASKIYRKFAS